MLQQLANKYHGEYQKDPIKKIYTPWETITVDIERAVIKVNGVTITLRDSYENGLKILLPIPHLIVKFYLFPKKGLAKLFGRWQKHFLTSKYHCNFPQEVLNEIQAITRIKNLMLQNKIFIQINDDFKQHRLVISQPHYEDGLQTIENLIELGLFFRDKFENYAVFESEHLVD